MKFNIQNQTPSIDKMQNIMNEYDVIHQEFLKQKELTSQKFKETFNDVIKDFFELVPSVKKVVWTQYTPYFNDGDTCTFGIYSPIFCNFDDDEFNRFESALLENPEVGDVITGTGGCRKVRWRRQGTGKSGGVRVIYYHLSASNRLYFLLVYPKNQQDNLTDAQKNALYNIIKGLG